ncbi:thiazole synthase [Natronospora cellulosivora (SeqCode)]
MNDNLIIKGKEFKSRLFVGTGKFADKKIIPDLIKKSNSEMLTVALRRVDFESDQENILKYINENCTVMINTSGARTADEAVRIARIAKAAGCGDWVKIEVIADNKYLLPDNQETIKATEVLAKEGFIVMPYVTADLMVAKKLKEVGAASVMPLGAPIGTNRGLKSKEFIRILIEEIDLPIIVDAGIGRPSHACEAMEMGADAVLVNTAIATASDPVLIGRAFAKAVEAGREAYLSGPASKKKYADASSPLTGFLND